MDGRAEATALASGGSSPQRQIARKLVRASAGADEPRPEVGAGAAGVGLGRARSLSESRNGPTSAEGRGAGTWRAGASGGGGAIECAGLSHPPSATLGGTIRSRRLELGLTQDDLSERAQIAKSYISQIETGVRRSPPSEPVLRRLERALSFDPNALVELGRWEATPASVKRLVRDIDGRASLLAAALRADADRGGAREPGEARSGASGAASLDDLFRSGVLARLVGGRAAVENGASGVPDVAGRDGPGRDDQGRALARQAMARRVPIINRVAAGTPAAYTDLDHPPRFADEYVDAPLPPLQDPDLFAARVTGDSMSPEYRDGDIVVFSPVVTVTDGMDCFARLEPDHESTFKRVYFERSEAGDGEGEDGGSLSGEWVRLEPLNPAHAVRRVPRERVAGLYAAVSVVRRLGVPPPAGSGQRTLHWASVGR